MVSLMNKSLFFSLFASLLTTSFLIGCSGSDGEITVEAAKTPLTDNGSDDAFTVTVKDAPEEGYAIDKITVKAKAEDKDAVDMTCTPNDANTNQKLDKGETVACKEGATNALGADLAGKEITVEVHAQVEGEDTLVGEATWTAAAK